MGIRSVSLKLGEKRITPMDYTYLHGRLFKGNSDLPHISTGISQSGVEHTTCSPVGRVDIVVLL